MNYEFRVMSYAGGGKGQQETIPIPIAIPIPTIIRSSAVIREIRDPRSQTEGFTFPSPSVPTLIMVRGAVDPGEGGWFGRGECNVCAFGKAGDAVERVPTGF
jgi:hypothetical protein